MSEERFDPFLLQMAQQSGGIRNLCDVFFSFLRRKTDFFAGQDSAIQEVIADSVLKHKALYEKQMASKSVKKKVVKKPAAKKVEKKTEEPKPIEHKKPEDVSLTQTKPLSIPGEVHERGGATETYTWNQTLNEVSVNIPIDSKLRAKNLNVVIKKSNIKINIKGEERSLIEGKFHKDIDTGEAMWTLLSIGDSKYIEVILPKIKTMEWWPCVIEGEGEIDTSKIPAEECNTVDDLDPETQKTVKKMMFDQRQKQMGLPSSDELQKQQMLQKFMAEHPEMDFSKTKIM